MKHKSSIPHEQRKSFEKWALPIHRTKPDTTKAHIIACLPKYYGQFSLNHVARIIAR